MLLKLNLLPIAGQDIVIGRANQKASAHQIDDVPL
jgi:hypothetical protein